MQTRSQTRHLSRARTSTLPPRMQTRLQMRRLRGAHTSMPPPRGGLRGGGGTSWAAPNVNGMRISRVTELVVEQSEDQQIIIIEALNRLLRYVKPEHLVEWSGQFLELRRSTAVPQRNRGRTPRNQEQIGVLTHEQNVPPQTNMQTGSHSCVREQTETQEQNLLPQTNMQTGPHGGPDLAGFDHDSGYDGRDVLREYREPELGGEREDEGVETETEIPNLRAELERDEGVQMRADIADLRAQIAEAKQKFYDAHLVPYMASLEMLQVIVSKLPLSTTPISFSEISQVFSKRIQGAKKYNFPASSIPEPNSVINSLVTKTWTSDLDIVVSVDQSEDPQPQAVHVSNFELSETFELEDLRKKLENAVKKHKTYMRKKRSSQQKEAHGDGDDGARDVDVGDVGDDDFGVD